MDHKYRKSDEQPVAFILSEIIKQCPMAMIITDVEGHICYINSVFTERTGYSLEELMGKNPRVLSAGLTQKKTYRDLWETLLAGKVWRGDLCNKTKTGVVYWEALTIGPIKNEKGEITYFAAFWNDVSDKKFEERIVQSQLKRYEYESRTDVLTGLYNRRHILKELQVEICRATRYKRSLTAMMIDLDGFKKINDDLGHLAGDIILRETTEIMQSSLRNIDILGRYGGDEFLAILPETNLEYAHIVAERIRRSIDEHIYRAHDKDIRLTVSIGLLQLENIKEIDEVAFLEKADQALLKAKKAGKNRIIEA